MSRNGCVKILWLSLFLLGVSFCIFPLVSNWFAKKKQEDVMNSERTSMIGILEIPSIDVKLPIYPDVKEEMLQYGVGHMKRSNLPGEGAYTHSLIVGHRGLPRASLLARLGEVKEGEHFFVTMEEEKFQYCVTDIRVIQPEDTSCLKVKNEKELLSIITCTPYGINTHRLVVTGERIQ